MSYPFDWVEDLIYGRVATGLPDLVPDIAWKNLTFDPAGRTVWLKVINAPITEEGITLGPTGDNELRGFLQVGIYTPIGEGSVERKEAYGRVSNLFDVPLTLAGPNAGTLVRFYSKGYSQGGQTSIGDFTRGGTEGVWDADYLTIYWLAREPKQRT